MIRANSPGNSPAWRALLAILLLSVACSSRASACTIPVFRYALERWEADRFQVIVYHNGPLTAEQSAALERLEQQSAVHGGPLNIELIRYDLRSAAPPKGLLVDKPSADQTLPRIEVRARDGGAQWVRR